MASERALPEQIGRYRAIRLLGQGAMGRVLLAHDPVLDRDVAVKLLRSDLGIAPEQRDTLLDRMRQEARASARVSHPGIVALHDMGEDPGCGLFLVFEYVEGWSLKEKLARGGLGLDSAARLALEVGSALSTAHLAGVLHRDIKPENIILSRTGAKIADFGIARVPDSTLTRDGGLLGTPAYSAPEAIAQGSFSPASDQFSMAATLYEAISLRRAFPGEDAVTVATRIATEHPAPIAELCALDPHVDAVLSRALSKDPKARFPTCDDFGRALAEALGMSPRARMATLPDRYHRRARPHESFPGRLPVAIGSALLGAIGALGVGYLITAGRSSDAGSQERPVAVPAELETAPVAWLASRPPAFRPARAARQGTPSPTPAESGKDAGVVDSLPGASALPEPADASVSGVDGSASDE